MTVRKQRVRDIDIAYRWDGNPAGPVVMMAHALGSSHRIWDSQIAALQDRYHLLRYDWRGHGETDAPDGPYTLAQFLDDAVGLMDVLAIEKVHWAGISTGGMIGQGLGIHFPDRIRSLTLCNTTSWSTDGYRAFVDERRKIVLEQGIEPVWEMTKRLWFSDAYVDAESAAYHAVRADYIRTPVAGYLGAMAAVADLAYRDELDRITAPVTIIAAGDDPVTPLERSEEIRDRIAGATLSVIEGQRHFSNVEVPNRFNAFLRAGLDRMCG